MDTQSFSRCGMFTTDRCSMLLSKKYTLLLAALLSVVLMHCSADTFSTGDDDSGNGGDSGMTTDGGITTDGALPDASDDKADNVVDGPATMDVTTEKAPTARLVFVTATTFDADLGGASGADSKCQAAATAASLPGTYYAWVSTSTSSPSTHFTTVGQEWRRVDSQLVASSFADLTSGTIHNAIDVDEHGSSVASGYTWTQTLTDGGVSQSVTGCEDFSSNTSSLSYEANLGNVAHTDSQWTFASQNLCNYQAHLLCFQQ